MDGLQELLAIIRDLKGNEWLELRNMKHHYTNTDDFLIAEIKVMGDKNHSRGISAMFRDIQDQRENPYLINRIKEMIEQCRKEVNSEG